jgi:fatty-acyl-CoA synthase
MDFMSEAGTASGFSLRLYAWINLNRKWVGPYMNVVNSAWLGALETTADLVKGGRTLPAMINRAETIDGQEWNNRPALIGEDESLTYEQLAARSRAYSRWALGAGLGPGGVVGLLMPNRPDYVAIWLGLTRVGVVAALLNTHLKGHSLAHCLTAAAPRHVIVAQELEEGLRQALAGAADAPAIWTRGSDGNLDPMTFSDMPLIPDAPGAGLRDTALLIYTSGTTGLPKAAHVSHQRLLNWSGWFAGMMGVTPDDRLYNCLPLYHATGGVAATGAMLLKGGSVVLRERFSASRFWDDVVTSDCTVFQYIGELCRYLTLTPPSPLERSHRLRLACGNGLRAGIWTAFQARFAIPRVLEFYASTEGTFSLYNVEGKVGSIGRVPGFLRHRFPAAIVRYDTETKAPLRGADGFCIRCAVDEAGEAVGKIAAPNSEAPNRFEGYTSAEESEKKVLRDVFEPGDAWLRTGDLMRIDAQGFYYFVDRIGDTFRWKGENVAAAEVAEAIGACPGVREAVVWGVEIPGAEGRAGMYVQASERSPGCRGIRSRDGQRCALFGYRRSLSTAGFRTLRPHPRW